MGFYWANGTTNWTNKPGDTVNDLSCHKKCRRTTNHCVLTNGMRPLPACLNNPLHSSLLLIFFLIRRARKFLCKSHDSLYISCMESRIKTVSVSISNLHPRFCTMLLVEWNLELTQKISNTLTSATPSLLMNYLPPLSTLQFRGITAHKSKLRKKKRLNISLLWGHSTNYRVCTILTWT